MHVQHKCWMNYFDECTEKDTEHAIYQSLNDNLSVQNDRWLGHQQYTLSNNLTAIYYWLRLQWAWFQFHADVALHVFSLLFLVDRDFSWLVNNLFLFIQIVYTLFINYFFKQPISKVLEMYLTIPCLIMLKINQQLIIRIHCYSLNRLFWQYSLFLKNI